MRQLWSSYALLPNSPQDIDGRTERKDNTLNSHDFLDYNQAATCNCHKHRRLHRHWLLLNLILSILSILIIFTWTKEAFTKNAILKKSSYYPPIFNRLKIPTATKQIQGSLFSPPNPSIGRAFPNPESDAIWEEIELPRTIAITADDVRRLGKDVETAVRFEDDIWGLGGDAFMGQIDVFHQLHCLNSLRKLGFREYYVNETKRDTMWYIHHNHCVDILLQNLMCSSNVDIITLNWMETQKQPYPDFSINHQCRDFETLLQWRKDNSVDMEKFYHLAKPKGVKEVPAPKEYYELFGEGGQGNKAQHNHEKK